MSRYDIYLQEKDGIRVGDRVHIIGGAMRDCNGEVICITECHPPIGVRLDEFNLIAHELNGQVDEGYGWWCDACNLEVMEAVEPMVVDDAAFDILFAKEDT